MKTWTLLAASMAILAAAMAGGQGEEKAKLSTGAKKPAQAAASGPVTIGEVHATIEKLEVAIRRVVLSSTQAPLSHNTAENRPATRSEVIGEFWRLYQLAKPNFKFTPRPVALQASSLTVPPADEMRKPLETLIKHGFVGKVSPLAAGTGPNMTLEDYGDALGFFLARIGDLTHTPSARWSPYMFNHRDGN